MEKDARRAGRGPAVSRLHWKEKGLKLPLDTYFPESDTKTALQGLARWIKRCTELGEALEAVGYEKKRRFYRKPEVELIVKFLGEP